MFTRFGYSKLQNHLEVSENEVRKAIPLNIPNGPSNIRAGGGILEYLPNIGRYSAEWFPQPPEYSDHIRYIQDIRMNTAS